MSPAGLESVPRALAVVVAGTIALHKQPALRGGGEPDERVAALLRTLAAGRPIVDLWGSEVVLRMHTIHALVGARQRHVCMCLSSPVVGRLNICN